MMLTVMLHLVNAELRVILNLYLELVMSGERAPLQDTGIFDINGRSFLVFMTLVIFQIILDGHFAIILPIFVQGGTLERFTFSATVRIVVLQIWDFHLLENLKYLLDKSLVKKSAFWPYPTSTLQSRHEADSCDFRSQPTGEIPVSLGSLQNLEIFGSVPSKLNNLTSLNELYLSTNNLNGSIPNLTGMNLLTYVGMSNNSFNASAIPTMVFKPPIIENNVFLSRLSHLQAYKLSCIK
ncbi:hypothetical protein P3S67_000725 [Capsicum chacoense]